jgi:two-component system NtrC family response regulator
VAPPDLRILVVDDEPDVREAVASLLEAFLDHVTVFAASSGGEGLAMMRNEAVDLILTDFKMPGMNGAQFLDAALKMKPGTPSIVLTAFDKEALQSLGLSRPTILHKPFEAQDLLQAVDHVLQAAGA